MRIRSLDLTNFKAFERFTLQFGPVAYLVGPNNAGKSTVISAIRACAYMIRFASAKSPDVAEEDLGKHVLAYSLDAVRLELDLDNLRHEFREEETRLSLSFTNGAVLNAVWPKPEPQEDLAIEEAEDGDEYDDLVDDDVPERPYGFFYIRFRDGSQPRRPLDVRNGLPRIGVIPILAPIEIREEILTREHVKRHVDRRLSSKHFRNQLYWWDLDDEVHFSDLTESVSRWLPGVSISELRIEAGELDLFFEEAGAHAIKEICWAGDGIQVWVQLLFHLLRTRGLDVVVLDEPEVFLHPDLQRRLVRLLAEQAPQVITSSHSAEVLAESPAESVLWVDKSRRRAIKAPPDPLLSQLARALGIEFNLRLAKALRTRVALFVEGDDMTILRTFARTLGARRVSDEDGVAQLSIKGFANWPQVEAFGWLTRDLLDSSVVCFVVLDGDYRSAESNEELSKKLAAVGVRPHIWARKELESYLIEVDTIAQLSGCPVGQVSEMVSSIVEGMRTSVLARRVVEEQLRLKSSKEHPVSIAERVAEEFELAWADLDRRVGMCPAKDVLADLNTRLMASGFKAVSTRAICQAMPLEQIPSEIAWLLDEVESAAAE